MSFNPGAKLDPSQVEDVRGSRVGRRGLAVGGGGLGLVVALVWVLLGGTASTGGTLGSLVDQTVGGGAAEPGPASTTLANECKTGADANARDDCRIVGYVNSIQAYWTDEFAALGRALRGGEDPLLHRSDQHRLRRRHVRQRSVLLPERCATSTSTSGSSTSCARRSAPRAARSPRPTSSPTSTGTTSRTSSERCPAGRARRGRPERRSGPSSRPTASRASGRATRRRRATSRRSRGRDRRRARCRVGRRRRPDPAGDAGPGQPRDLDPRLVRPAPEVVHHRLRDRHAGSLRHVQRHPLRPGQTGSARVSGGPRAVGSHGATTGGADRAQRRAGRSGPVGAAGPPPCRRARQRPSARRMMPASRSPNCSATRSRRPSSTSGTS